MKDVSFSPTFQKKYQKIKATDPELGLLIKKQLQQFKSNPHHPSLRTHKLKGNLKQVFSISVTRKIRILFLEDHQYYFFDIGTHEQMYKK